MTKTKKELREEIKEKQSTIDLFTLEIINLEEAIQQQREEVVEKFSEFCHTKYKGCSQASGEWEYSYEGEIITMAEEFLSSLKKGETK